MAPDQLHGLRVVTPVPAGYDPLESMLDAYEKSLAGFKANAAGENVAMLVRHGERLAKGLRAAGNEIRMRTTEEPLRANIIERLAEILRGD